MSFHNWLALAAMASLPFAAAAQQKQTGHTPADPAAPTAAFRYESAFSHYRAPADESQSPDKLWRLANDNMEKLGGHAGHMKAEGPAPDAAAPGKSAPTQSAVPTSVPGKHH